jgi:hypothetical protein
VLTVKPPPPMDFNQDQYVDSADLDMFNACFTGPNVPYDPNNLPPGCTLVPVNGFIAADVDFDGDVDQEDYSAFQRCWSGTDIASLGCRN